MQSICDLIEQNIGLIKSQLVKLKLYNDPDAESIGYEALYNAVSTFDQTKGYKLSTYATCCIYNALGSYIRTLNKKRQLEIISYNNIAYAENGTVHEYQDFIADTHTVESICLDNELITKVNEAFNDYYESITNVKHKRIILVWRESSYTATNKEVAQKVGVSQPYVNQVISIFKAAMRKRLEEYYDT